MSADRIKCLAVYLRFSALICGYIIGFVRAPPAEPCADRLFTHNLWDPTFCGLTCSVPDPTLQANKKRISLKIKRTIARTMLTFKINSTSYRKLRGDHASIAKDPARRCDLAGTGGREQDGAETGVEGPR